MKSLSELVNKQLKSKSKNNDASSLENDDREETKDAINDVAGVTKKIQKFKRKDYADAQLIHIGLPRKLIHSGASKCRKRFGVDIHFIDKKTGKKRTKLVRFGKEGKEEFVDHHDVLKRQKCISKLSNDENWMHGNFYKLNLLNSKFDNVYDAHKALISNLGLL